jgi:hypothetical protein
MITGKHTSFQLDKIIGDIGEISILPKLAFFHSYIVKTKGFEKWDYVDGSGCLYELKTRRCCKNTYGTTFLPTHKIIEGKDQVFLFNFLDKLCYIRYDKEVFGKFWVEDLIDGRYDYEKKPVPHFHIPVSLLLDL